MTARTTEQGMLSDAHRGQLLARLREGARAPVPVGISRRDSGLVEVPLSFGQEQLWFIDWLAPGLPTYNIAEAVRMCGRLDVGVLGSALGLL